MLAGMAFWRVTFLYYLALAGSFPAPAFGQVTVEAASLMTTPVYLLEGTKQVSQGTGFFFGIKNPQGVIDTVFLVTNYHVVTGHSPGSTLPRQGDRVVFYLHKDQNEPSEVKQVILPLYSTAGTPLWEQSTEHLDADVILLPLPKAAFEGIRMFVFEIGRASCRQSVLIALS